MKLARGKNVRSTRRPQVSHGAESVQALLRSLNRSQTRALIFEYTAEAVATMFRGNDAKPPSKLLLMADGARRRADIDDVVEIEKELLAMSLAERAAFATLNDAKVVVERADGCGDTVSTTKAAPSAPGGDATRPATKPG